MQDDRVSPAQCDISLLNFVGTMGRPEVDRVSESYGQENRGMQSAFSRLQVSWFHRRLW